MPFVGYMVVYAVETCPPQDRSSRAGGHSEQDMILTTPNGLSNSLAGILLVWAQARYAEFVFSDLVDRFTDRLVLLFGQVARANPFGQGAGWRACACVPEPDA